MTNKVPLWTIQTAHVYSQLLRDGFIVGPTKYDYEHDPYFVSDKASALFIKPYMWLSEYMVRNIGLPPNYDPKNTQFPLWAWFQYEDHKHKKPDLRSRAHLPKGTDGVRIKFLADPSTVLLSDFDNWHYVLSNWYLGQNKKQDDDFDRRFSKATQKGDQTEIKACNEIIRESWSRIFIKDTTKKLKAHIQATFWKIEWGQVVQVTKFTAR
ncbi:MAG: DUF3841 domain-containing protein [Methanomassiliicoccales archaeon]|jgi:hypothetical protein